MKWLLLFLSVSTALASDVPGLSIIRVGAAADRSLFSAAPLSLNVSQYQYVLDGNIPISTDFDVVSVDLSYYGLPWNSFLYEEPLPVSWATRLDAMVKAVDAYELPVFLQFAIAGNDKRSCPTSNASDYPGTTSPGVADFTGCVQCFDYDIIRNPIASFIRQGFINYALAVSLAFNYTQTLAIINFGIDANRYLEYGCSTEQWNSYVDFTQEVYRSLCVTIYALSRPAQAHPFSLTVLLPYLKTPLFPLSLSGASCTRPMAIRQWPSSLPFLWRR